MQTEIHLRPKAMDGFHRVKFQQIRRHTVRICAQRLF
jgi:hypothetical protein